jgi:tape measure domain-containing protein
LHIEKLLEGLDREGRERQKSFDDELAAFDRQLDARERRRRGRITPGQAVQTAGAVISGGIFGGPEGFLGGLGGAALGASIPALGIVGGAFAGSAAGAQLGMFRQQIAGTADYAAQIGKLQIALRGIVGNQDDYNRAIAAAASVTRDLNIPQAEATRGLTRLSAAVLGAGGTVNDSAFAFRAMSEAVKATGGNAEQVDGALLALTQVFSKGKVSAEELNQIAERLPGTFTLFAQAAGRSGPELQKALEQGQVGLNDLMKFLELLGGRYGNTALKIASSSEDAGARLQVAFDDMRLQVGRAIQPIGAEIQDAFADFLVEITPALVEATRLVGEGFKYLADNTSKDIDSFRVGLELLGEAGAALNPLGTAIQLLNQTLTDLGISIKVSMPDIAAGMQMLLRSINPVQAALETIGQLRQLAGLGPAQPAPAATRRAPQPSAATPRGARSTFPEPKSAGDSEKEAKRRQKEEARERKNLFSELLSELNAQNAVLAKQGRLNESIAKTETVKAAVALSTAEQILRNEKAQLDLRLKFGEISKKVYDDQQKAIKLETETVRQEFTKTVKKLKEEADALLKEVTGPGGVAGPTETPLQRASREITEDIAKRRARALQIGGVAGQAAFEGLGALDVRQIASRQVAGPMIADLEKQIRDLQRMGPELSTLDRLKQEFLGGWDALDPVLRRQLELLAAQKDALVQQTQAAKDMKQLYSDIGISIKDGVVSAIQGAIDGTKSLQQVASDLLNSIANRLLDVAINFALFGVMSGTGTGGGLLGSLFKSAKGNAFAKNGIVPFAYGGVVNRPTLFPFAKGIGLMGEAGPEAILPLRRGSDGRLGVSSSGGGSTVVNVSVDASGTAVEGDGPGANQMGRIIGAAVQAEIVKMQRPGGLLANTR